jgi:hypothetical protein
MLSAAPARIRTASASLQWSYSSAHVSRARDQPGRIHGGVFPAMSIGRRLHDAATRRLVFAAFYRVVDLAEVRIVVVGQSAL